MPTNCTSPVEGNLWIKLSLHVVIEANLFYHVRHTWRLVNLYEQDSQSPDSTHMFLEWHSKAHETQKLDSCHKSLLCSGPSHAWNHYLLPVHMVCAMYKEIPCCPPNELLGILHVFRRNSARKVCDRTRKKLKAFSIIAKCSPAVKIYGMATKCTLT